MSEEIAARPLKPELYRLNGISRVSVEAHYRLYQGYVAKRNEIVALAAAGRRRARRTRSTRSTAR